MMMRFAHNKETAFSWLMLLCFATVGFAAFHHHNQNQLRSKSCVLLFPHPNQNRQPQYNLNYHDHHHHQTQQCRKRQQHLDNYNKECQFLTQLNMVGSGSMNRENEIRRKIARLKKEGKLRKNTSSSGNNNDDNDDDDKESSLTTPISEYEDKVRKKIGEGKAKMLGMQGSGEDNDDDNNNNIEQQDANDEKNDDDGTTVTRKGQLGSLPQKTVKEEQAMSYYGKVLDEAESDSGGEINILDPTLYENEEIDDDEDDMNNDMEEEELVNYVAERLAEKSREKARLREQKMKESARVKLEELQKEREEKQQQQQQRSNDDDDDDDEQQQPKQITSGIGGSWKKNNETKSKPDYKPSKSGTWGVFERPKDISKAYGGGRRIGPGYSNEEARKRSEDDTRAKLRAYREKVGIDVESEKIHAEEIEEARKIAAYAMERGVYASAVSALEKVTKYCSSNSPIGGMVFLDLAMAYEAVGRTEEAITVYTTLTTCRMEDIKYNAKRLLYGIEAMQFMQNDVKSYDFSRKKIKNTFIETTGMDNIAANFDDRYETAYIDLKSKGFYKKLSENVVRSNREARQILLKAVGAGEVERVKIIQALRSISRNFDDSLQNEIQNKRKQNEPQAMLNGKPIISSSSSSRSSSSNDRVSSFDEFVLGSPEQMIENMNGEWRLQLLADKRGDGVKFFNTSLSWQYMDTISDPMTFESLGSAGFLGASVEQSGTIEFENKRRIIKHKNVQSGGAAGMLFGSSKSGAVGAITIPHQIISVDSILLITRFAPSKRRQYSDSEKEYFAVWRRVETGKYSSVSSSSSSSSSSRAEEEEEPAPTAF